MEDLKKLTGPQEFAEKLIDEQLLGNLDLEYVDMFRKKLLYFVEEIEKNIAWTEVRRKKGELCDFLVGSCGETELLTFLCPSLIGLDEIGARERTDCVGAGEEGA